MPFNKHGLGHLMEKINQGLLHRAFSIFLFDSQNRLLLQQRSEEKITFPGYWTNTVCSHPLHVVSNNTYNVEHSSETEEKDQLGVKRAAKRKLEHELGIKTVNVEDFTFLTRIHYKSGSDEIWGEHEIDYILIARQDVTVDRNKNEAMDHRFITKEELKQFFIDAPNRGIKLTPWFKLIVENFIFKWWDNLDDLQSQIDIDTIHHMMEDKTYTTISKF